MFVCADAITWSAGVDSSTSRDRLSSVTYTKTPGSGNTSNFYGDGSDDSDGDGSDNEGTSKGKGAVNVSDALTGLVIGNSSVAKEYMMVDDHQMLIKSALQLIKVGLRVGS